MIVTYTPKDGDKQAWEFDPDDIRESAAELIEKRMGKNVSFDEFKISVVKGGARARRVLLWHLLRQDHHTLRYEDSPDPTRRELLVEFDVAELTQMIEVFHENPSMFDTELEQQQAIAQAEAEIAKQRAAAGEPDEPEPAAPDVDEPEPAAKPAAKAGKGTSRSRSKRSAAAT